MLKEEDIKNYLIGLGSERKEEQKVENNYEILEKVEVEGTSEEVGEEN